MKITLDAADLSSLAKTFCPSLLTLHDGRIALTLNGKKIVLGETTLALQSSVDYNDQVSGDLDLKLDPQGVSAELKLK